MLKKIGDFHGEDVLDISVPDQVGRSFEKVVFDKIKSCFPNEKGEAYLNQSINTKKPDMVIPVIDFNGRKSLLLIECKHINSGINVDGTTVHGDAIKQIKEYEEILQNKMKESNKSITIYPLIIVSESTQHKFNSRSELTKGVFIKQIKDLSNFLYKFSLYCREEQDFDCYVNHIYHRNSVFRFKRMSHLDERQRSIALSVGKGGVERIVGVAGTGKTLILLYKAVFDFLQCCNESRSRKLLYVTYNKSLLKKFSQEFKKELLEHRKVDFKIEEKPNYMKVTYSNSEFIFLNTDTIHTKLMTYALDDYGNYGEYYRIHKKHVEQMNFKQIRLEIIDKINTQKHKIERLPKFDHVYLDEFQDVLVDSSKFEILKYLLKDDFSMVVSEDPLQSYVKLDVFREIQELDDSIMRKDSKNYKQIFNGLPYNKSPKVLTKVYRTPKGIFNKAKNLLHNTDSLLVKGKKQLERLEFTPSSYEFKVLSLRDLKRRIVDHDEFFVIESNKAFNQRNVYASNHEYNCRGLEHKNVAIIVCRKFYEEPHFLYTLLTRSMESLSLVKSDCLSEKEFERFLELFENNSIYQVDVA